MVEEVQKKFFCFVLLRDICLLVGKITLVMITSIFRSIFPKSKKSLKDEVVLVTGAARGLGKQLALKFAELEAVIVLWDINEKELRETETQIRQEGGRAHAYVCDVSDWASVSEMGRKVQQEVGDVTVLVNNAGILQNVAFVDLDIQKIRRTFEVNVMSHFWTNKYFLPRMLDIDKGHIVAISSMAGLAGWLYMADYSATKFGIVGLMETLEEELRIVGKGDLIHCTTACPVTIDTGLNHNPTTRRQWLVPILNVESTAATIVDAVQRNERILTVPRRLYFSHRVQRLFPRKVMQLILDFLEYNVIPNNTQN